MKRRPPSMVIALAIGLLLPRPSYGAEAMQKIRIGLPIAGALLHASLRRPRKRLSQSVRS